MNLDNPSVNAPISQCPWIPIRVPVVCSTCLEGSLQAGAEPGPPPPNPRPWPLPGVWVGDALGQETWPEGWLEVGPGERWPESGHPL